MQDDAPGIARRGLAVGLAYARKATGAGGQTAALDQPGTINCGVHYRHICLTVSHITMNATFSLKAQRAKHCQPEAPATDWGGTFLQDALLHR